MITLKTSKRRVIRRTENRFVRVLSLIYEIEYRRVQAIFNSYDQSVERTKAALERITQADYQLSIIN